ncbi:MAG: xanthine dehydrogenase accessory protein XdhC [Rhizobiales bacterium 65-9]|nr:xanthine dehydrogenase accessory protein XdhC [Hyphomicrobiales bacterium]OJY37885.1 MAG: xanthine dehydrogenase accessory protein XdhC [Rhizobiales bacterium 65-9]
MIAALAPALHDLLARGEAVVIARISEAMGSTPRETGATMLIAAREAIGSIGGGQLEFHAIDVARAMIATGEERRDLDIPLGPALGQCCGGRVAIALERAGPHHLAMLGARDARLEAAAPSALIFGAGHTGRALASALAPLPAKTLLIDDRPGLFDDIPPAIRCARLDDPQTALDEAPTNAAFIILTHSHALDYRLADAGLRRGDAAYVGMIGSATKKVRFARWFAQRGGTREQLARLTCPIGGGLRDKRPEIIAALTAADIVRALFSAERATAQTEVADGRAA